MHIMHAGKGDCKNKQQDIGFPVCSMDKMSEAEILLLKKGTRYNISRNKKNEARNIAWVRMEKECWESQSEQDTSPKGTNYVEWRERRQIPVFPRSFNYRRS